MDINRLFSKGSWFNNFYLNNLKGRGHLFLNLSFCILIFGFVSFWLHEPIKSVFDRYLVSPILSKFIIYSIDGFSSYFFISIWIVLIGFLIWKVYSNKYILNGFVVFIFLYISALYWLERLVWKNYSHLNLSNPDIFERITFFDPIFFLLVLISLFTVFNSIKWKFKEEHESWLELDLPKNKITEDKLNRSNEVNNFIQLLNKLPKNEKRSHVIGLVGSWGYGKTSFLSMFKEEIEKKSIVIDFNPWITSSTSNLIEDFFILLDDKISEHIQTNGTIYKYGKSLSNLTQDSNLISELKSLLFPEKPLNERIKNISSLVTKLGKEVYCIVDDLDRLDSDEVFEVLRIVRNTANFPNFTFVMAYDKKYLIHSLEARRLYNAEKYLDKIVQLEVALPWISKFKLRTELINLIQSKLEIAFEGNPNVLINLKKQVTDLILGVESEKRTKYKFNRLIISDLFLNMRDIVKFSNSFVFFLKNHSSRIYVPDLFFLELIKFIDISLLSRLAANDYTISVNNEGISCFELYRKPESEEDMDFSSALFSPSTTIDKVLSGHSNESRLIDLIENCFSKPNISDYNSNFSLCYVDNFEFYFSFYLNDNQVSFDYIKSLISEDEV